jgi:acetyl esterase/lipase
LARLVYTAIALVFAAAAIASPAARQRHTRATERPYVLLIHGGSWYRTDQVMVGRIEANRPRLHAGGYATDFVRYRPRREAFPDVLAAYDRLRRRVGAATPICAWGQSAGAHMALMLAIRRPDVACVVSEAGPTELQRLGAYLRGRAHDAFGDELARWSPALYRLLTPTLLEQATNDRLVPFGQLAAMQRAAPDSQAVVLSAGTAPWIHSRVDPRQLAHAHVVEQRFLRAAVERWRQDGRPRRRGPRVSVRAGGSGS